MNELELQNKSKTHQEISEIKSKLIDLLYWIFLITMWFALLGTVFRAVDIGIKPVNYLQIFMILFFIGSFILKKHFSYLLKTSLLLSTILILGLGGIFSFGLYSQGILFIFLFVVLSSVLLNKKWGYISLAVSSSFLILAATLFILKIITIDPEVQSTVNSFSGWFMAILIFFIISIIIIVFWQKILDYLITKIDVSLVQEENLAKINKLLKKEIETRTETQAKLRNQYNESQKLNEKYQEINIELQNAFHNLEKSNLLIQEAKEKAQSADRLKSSFLSNMSHEIRTPLNAIVGFSALLTNKEVSSEEYNNYLKIIQTSTNSLLTTISDIVNMAKIEAGQYTLYPQLIELNSFIDNIIHNFKNEINQKNNQTIQFEIKKLIPNPCNVIIDKQSMTHIISKLIDNAIKFTKEGNITATFKLLPDTSLNVVVEDTGIGIAHTAKKEIYEKFRQLDNQNSRKYGGTGLGLSIAKGLLDLLNGNIEFESLPGKGTTFKVSIPLILKNILIDFDSSEKWKGKTILIIGKEAWECKELNKVLQESNAILKFVESGFQAIDIYKQHPEINLSIFSMNINDMNPYKTLKIIKQIRPLMPVLAYLPKAFSLNSIDSSKWDGIIQNPPDKEKLLKSMEIFLGTLKN